MKTYDVKREYLGDKFYRTGERREANPADVAHHVKNGVLAEIQASETKQVKTSLRSTKAKSNDRPTES